MALLKWAGITSVIGGLVGGGTLFGLDRLASSVSDTRSTALGLGASYGGVKAFNVNYGRLGDTEVILRRVALAKMDPTERRKLNQLGLSNAEIDNDDADVLASKAVTAAQRIAKQTPSEQLGNSPILLPGGSGIFDIGQLRQLKEMETSETGEMASGYRKSTAANFVSPESQKKIADFFTQLRNAVNAIETTFIKNLVHIEPGLKKLSTAFTDLLTTLLRDNGPVSHWLDELNSGLKWLAVDIDKPEFQRTITAFIEVSPMQRRAPQQLRRHS